MRRKDHWQQKPYWIPLLLGLILSFALTACGEGSYEGNVDLDPAVAKLEMCIAECASVCVDIPEDLNDIPEDLNDVSLNPECVQCAESCIKTLE